MEEDGNYLNPGDLRDERKVSMLSLAGLSTWYISPNFSPILRNRSFEQNIEYKKSLTDV
jgi:hypothetical protein